MIAAEEIRIGNWLKLGKEYTRVYQILYSIVTGQSINHADYKEEFFEPIPLTPEILIGCGFKKAPIAENTFAIDSFFYDVETLSFCWDDESITHWESIDIKYLHQLQNLYFALTNKELEITL